MASQGGGLFLKVPRAGFGGVHRFFLGVREANCARIGACTVGSRPEVGGGKCSLLVQKGPLTFYWLWFGVEPCADAKKDAAPKLEFDRGPEWNSPGATSFLGSI